MNNDVEVIPVKGVSPSVQVQSDNVIYVPQAHKNKAGIVKEGDGVLIENGVVSLNKQTVEDMIDANKWVSYGFQQNLTEDEKGMARHNIGAGDNYFTGSYYDLTQKPHLNTNNTTGLDYGDEELNDTINLHKISKTGSFNDLKHVPQETIDFAESERQKSKNLFDFSNVKFIEGSTAVANYETSTITLTKRFGNQIDLRINKVINDLVEGINYTLSFARGNDYAGTYIVIQFDNALADLTWHNYGTISFTQEQIDNLKFLFFYGTDDQTTTISKIQVEEGSVATDYQPYNGQITHNGDASVTFAESERQKTLNLFNPRNNNRTNSLSSITTIVEDNLIRVSSDGVHGSTRVQYLAFELTQYVGRKLYFKCNYATSSTNDTKVIFWLANSVNDYTTQIGFTPTITGSGSFSTSFVVPNDLSNGKYLMIMFYSAVSNNASGYVDFSDIMLSTEDIAYIAYNGAIVHEKQLPKITTLWTNPNLSNDFSSQTITLANDNYDYAIMICAGRTNELDTQVSFFFEKGTAPILNYVLTSTDAAYSVENICRRVLYTNNTALNIGNCTYSLTANAGVVANNLLIPYKVIGIKMGE